jgi:hypothetical protein
LSQAQITGDLALFADRTGQRLTSLCQMDNVPELEVATGMFHWLNEGLTLLTVREAL